MISLVAFISFVAFNKVQINNIVIPFTDAFKDELNIVQDMILEKKLNAVMSGPNERIEHIELRALRVVIDDKGKEIHEKEQAVYTNDRVDNMLRGVEDLNRDELHLVNSLVNNNAEFIRKLFWRYLPVPLFDLANVQAVRESPYNRLESSHPDFRTASRYFTQEILRMPITDYFDRINCIYQSECYLINNSAHIRKKSLF